MRDLLVQKFGSGQLREKLLATGDAELVEENTWGDTFWGVCNGRRENMLGTLLMDIRALLRECPDCRHHHNLTTGCCPQCGCC